MRQYGALAPFDPPQVAEFMAGFARPWWLVGGWAIEAFTGAPREHEDVDLSILACDVPALRAHVGEDEWHLWSNDGGTLRPAGRQVPRAAQPRQPDLGPPQRPGPVGHRPAHHAGPRRPVDQQADARPRRPARRGDVGGRRRHPLRACPRSRCSTRPPCGAARTTATSTAACPLLAGRRPRVAARQRRPAVSRARLARSPLLTEPPGHPSRPTGEPLVPGGTHP